MYRGYVKIWRKTFDSFIYGDSQMVHLWVHLLMTANYEDRETMFNGSKILVKRGQLITGRKSLSSSTRIGQQVIRRILNQLETSHLINQQKTNKYTTISIINYNEHQDINQRLNQQITNKKPTDNQQITTSKESKALKNTTREGVLFKLEIPADLLESEVEIKDWLEYKQQKGQSYKPKGLEALWRAFRTIPKDRRRETVDNSMANNWAGLYEKTGVEKNRNNDWERRPPQRHIIPERSKEEVLDES